jgi:hypothetical protein
MITAQIASVPSRINSLQKTVESILPQVTFLFVALNGYEDIPKFLVDNPKIKNVLMDNRFCDSAKFYDIEERQGYIFTIDDDLVYPKTYVQDMIKGIDKFNCVVTLHGRTYPRPFTNYYRLEHNYRCLNPLDKNAYVDVGGTGVMAWHSDRLKVKFSDFKLPNMADIWMSKIAHEQKVPIMVLAHKINYLQHTRHEDNIFTTRLKQQHKEETEILKSILNGEG